MKVHKIKSRTSRINQNQPKSNMKKWVITGITLTAAAIMTGGIIGYAKNPTNVRLGLADRLYHSLPAETQTEYAVELFLEQEQSIQADVVKYFVNNDLLSETDNAYVGTTAILNLDPDKRAATLELIMQESPYDVTRHVTIYGINNLTPSDNVEVIKNSGKNLWDHFSQKVQQAYEFLFGDY